MKRIQWFLLAAALAIPAAAADIPTVTFTLSPIDGLLAGPQGTAAGWGYSVSTDSGFLLINSITFEDLTPVGAYSTPGISSAIIANGSPVTVPWTLGLDGLQYDIDPGAIVGSQTTGTMDLNFEWFSDAGLGTDNGAFDVLATNANFGTVTAEVDVLQGTAPQVPEPASMVLLGSAVLGLWLKRKSVGWR